MPTVVLVGDGGGLAAKLGELGIDIATSVETATPPVFVVGLGADGPAALLHGSRDDVAGVVGIDCEPPVEAARAGTLRAPVLALFAEADEGAAYSFAKALGAHGVLNETVVYDEVGRGFFGRHEQATADAWRLLRRFMGVPAPE